MLFIAFLMLIVPGLVSLRLHGVSKIGRQNWQDALFAFLVYSLAIIFLSNVIMFITYKDRTVSFSPFDRAANSNIFKVGFIVKYTALAMLFSFTLPKLWAHIKAFSLSRWKNRKTFLQWDE